MTLLCLAVLFLATANAFGECSIAGYPRSLCWVDGTNCICSLAIVIVPVVVGCILIASIIVLSICCCKIGCPWYKCCGKYE
jgi:hypothetical protein